MNVTNSLPRLGQLLAAALILTGSHALGQTVTAIPTVDTGTTITQGYTFSGEGPGDIPLSFSSFDNSTGDSLTGVTIELTGITSTGSAVVYNISNYPIPIGAGPPGYPEYLTGGFTSTYVATSSVSGSDTVTVTAISPTQTSPMTVTAGGSFTTSQIMGTQSPNPQSTAVADYSSYSTSGTTTVTVTLNAATTVNASGSAPGEPTAYVAGNASALASGTLELIYTYTPVPEPSKTAACMIGFALCLLVGRNYFKGRSLGLA